MWGSARVSRPGQRRLECMLISTTGVYEDLENYSVEPKEGVVLGKLEHKKSGKHDVQITVWAFQIKKKGEQERDEL